MQRTGYIGGREAGAGLIHFWIPSSKERAASKFGWIVLYLFLIITKLKLYMKLFFIKIQQHIIIFSSTTAWKCDISPNSELF
jgi:hypothetical protein